MCPKSEECVSFRVLNPRSSQDNRNFLNIIIPKERERMEANAREDVVIHLSKKRRSISVFRANLRRIDTSTK